MNKPKNTKEYCEWLKKEFKIELSDKNKNYYNAVSAKLHNDIVQSPFWQQLISNLNAYDAEYYIHTNYPLLIGTDVRLLIKSYESTLEKSFRKNVLDNRQWPDPPSNGWIDPTNWFEKTNDILRGQLVVKYLDGVEFLASKLKSLCDSLGHDNSVYYEARMEGYYAAHFYLTFEAEIAKEQWDTKKVRASLELQITTQLQEVIRKLLHSYYEKRRIDNAKGNKWQWDYKSNEFATNYLGHILHYLEGMIMDIREKSKEKSK